MHIGLELISVFLKFEFYIPTFLFPKKKIYIYICALHVKKIVLKTFSNTSALKKVQFQLLKELE